MGQRAQPRRALAAERETGEITAVLGPTNTGKTHRAVERMLTHKSGIIGLPLRLLAREIYDRITPRIGERRVALVTGEEKRVPARPDYWVCTVESMPLDREVDFVCVDEIQLAAHRERGHTFTERLMRNRGTVESWFLGSDTMRDAVAELAPGARVETHPRFSRLTHVAPTGVAALPPRTAVVTFGVSDVYALAERVRSYHGGTAVVLGALSPRARNAQVAMYEAGEVQYMVATDAIGMGLNLDLDRVVFAATSKFDGRDVRNLEFAELGQIAGRAGRYTRDGEFGRLKPLPDFGRRAIESVQNHRFAPVRSVVWRNSDLSFASIEELVGSLRIRPTGRTFRMIERADDFDALVAMARREDVRKLASHPRAIELLWEVCRVPDFRKLLVETHVELLATIYGQLVRAPHKIDVDWLARKIARLDRDDGDIDALMGRIAFARTWSYIVNRDRWVEDADHWRSVTGELEDRLSDALHARLTDRFVADAPRGSPLRTRAVRSGSNHRANVHLEVGHPFHRLMALRDATADELALPHDWVEAVIDADHEAIALDGDGRLVHGGRVVAQLRRGSDLLHPGLTVLGVDELGAGARARLSRRLLAWLRDALGDLVGNMRELAQRDPSAAVRGLAYQLEQGLGTVVVSDVPASYGLRRDERRRIRNSRVVVGRHSIFYEPALRVDRLQLRAALWGAWVAQQPRTLLPRADALSLPVDDAASVAFERFGFVASGSRALRADHLEQVDARLRSLVDERGEFTAADDVAALFGCGLRELVPILRSLGFRQGNAAKWVVVKRRNRSRSRSRSR